MIKTCPYLTIIGGMKSLLLKNKKDYIFFLISMLFYFAIDLISVNLVLLSTEIGVSFWLLSKTALFASFFVLLKITCKAKCKNPAILLGIVCFVPCYVFYSQFSDRAIANLYYHGNKDTIASLVREISNIEAGSGVLRIPEDHNFVVADQLYAFVAHEEPLHGLMDNLGIQLVKKHNSYSEYSIPTNSFSRLSELTLFHLLDDDSVSIYYEVIKQPSVVESAQIDNDWYYIVYNYNMLSERHANWGSNYRRE